MNNLFEITNKWINFNETTTVAMKKNNLPPVAIQARYGHSDSSFYMVGVGENSVSGFFEGILQGFNGEYDSHSGQAWEVPFITFLEACAEHGVITDHDRGLVWFAYDPDECKGVDAREWAAYWLEENAATSLLYTVLESAVWAQFEGELSRIAKRLSEFDANPERLWDEDISNAAKDFAAIVVACSEWPYLLKPVAQFAPAH